MSPLFGFEIRVADYLKGSKKAVRQGNTIFVSPAMWDLMKHASDQAELEHLLSKIELVEIPKMDFFDIPMTVTNPFERGW
jgi:hypothetical protein